LPLDHHAEIATTRVAVTTITTPCIASRCHSGMFSQRLRELLGVSPRDWDADTWDAGAWDAGARDAGDWDVDTSDAGAFVSAESLMGRSKRDVCGEGTTADGMATVMADGTADVLAGVTFNVASGVALGVSSGGAFVGALEGPVDGPEPAFTGDSYRAATTRGVMSCGSRAGVIARGGRGGGGNCGSAEGRFVGRFAGTIAG
jgi:hypothetical protein